MQVEVITLERSELERLIDTAVSRTADELRSDIAHARTPELMTKAQLADYLQCDTSKINRYMSGGMPFHKFGGHPRFRKSAIDKWLDVGVQTIQRKTDNGQR